MRILYLITFVIYIALAVVIYKTVKEQLEDKWASRLILAFLILLPTYDIIITKALLFYYCNFTETEKIYRTVENPESVYFENAIPKLKPVNDYEKRNLPTRYLLEKKSLKSLEFYNGKNSILHYELDKDGKIVKSEIDTPLSKYHVYRKVKDINGFVDNFIYTKNIIIKDAVNDEAIADLNNYKAKRYNFMFIGAKNVLNEGCDNNIFETALVTLKLLDLKIGDNNDNK